jgi:hypothetical protein
MGVADGQNDVSSSRPVSPQGMSSAAAEISNGGMTKTPSSLRHFYFSGEGA